MKLLCLDIGNTSITICDYKNEKLGEITRVASDENFINQLTKYNLGSFDYIILCSVVPNLTKLLINYCKNHSINIYEINYKNSHLNLHVDNPSEVGNDRICNAIAAKKLNFNPSIIIDFGTATTFDVINKDGAYIGGVICPGINLSLQTLHKAAARLPRVAVAKPDKVIGTTTVSAMTSGIYHGYIGLIKNIVELITLELKYKTKIILTGGLADLFSKNLGINNIIKKNLTIEGLYLAYKNAKLKKND